MADTVVGSFVLTERLGRGGMGEVWRATHRDTGVPVAVKLLTSEAAQEARFLDAFADEVRAAAALTHRHVVTIFDYGAEPGGPWLAMELAHGGTLTRHCGRLDWPACRAVLSALLDALAHAHARGILHRDLKPDNVLVDDPRDLRRGVKITDFGLATERWMGGTPAFMPPEQWAARWDLQGPWTDLFAFGRLAIALAATDPGAQSTAIPVPAGFLAWTARLTAAHPDDRYRYAADAAWALEQLGDGPRVPVTLDAPPATSSTASTWTADQLNASAPALPTFDPAVALGPREMPPIPPTWRRGDTAAPHALSLEWVGTGLGLWGLRTFPLVGRAQERDQLWQALMALHRHGHPGLVVLRGPGGVGKSRLAQWLCERAHEVGAAGFVSVGHDAEHGAHPPDGRFLRGLPDSLDIEAVARLTEARPLVMWLDDVHVGGDSLSLARRIVGGGSLPVLVVMTVTDELLADRPLEGDLLQALLALPGAASLDVAPLPQEEGLALVQAILGADPELAAHIEERAQGFPLYAEQLVSDCVERGLLAPGPFGYRLRVPLEETDRTGAWAARIERVLSGRPRDDGGALELAAVLGTDVRAREWVAVCAAAGLTPSDDLVDRLVVARLARKGPEGWSLAHALLRAALLRRADRRGTLGPHREVCLAVLQAGADPADQARIGRLLLDLGALEAPISSLFQGALYELSHQRPYGALVLLDAWEAAMSAAAIPASDRRWWDGWIQRARLCVECGRFQDALADTGRVKQAAEGSGDLAILRLALCLESRVHFARGALPRAAACLDAARALPDPAHEVLVRLFTGDVHVDQGRLDEAEACFRWVLDHAADPRREPAAPAEADDRRPHAFAGLDNIGRAHYGLAYLALQRGRLDEAARHTAAFVQVAGAESIGPAQGSEMLARIARRRGDLDEAERHLLLARHHFRLRGDDHAILGQLGLLQVERGRFEEARHTVERAVALAERLERTSLWATLVPPLLRCLAHAGDWEAFDARLDVLAKRLEAHGLADADMAGQLVEAGEQAFEAGHAGRARAVLALAVHQFERLGTPDQAQAVRDRAAGWP